MSITTIKADYFKYNGTSWEKFYFRTSADLVHETELKKFITPAEKTKIADYLSSFNVANKLLQLDADAKVPVEKIPDISNTYLTKTNPAFIGTLQGGMGLFNTIGAYNSINNTLIIGSEPQEQGSAFITFKDNANGDGEMELYAFAGIKLLSNNNVIDVSNNWIKNLRAPINNGDAVNKEYVDNKVSSGFVTREPVKSASTANIDITAVLNSLDGFTLSANDRVLLKNQTTTSQNGVYKLDSTKKPVKVDNDSKLGSAVFVENGDTNNDYIYHCSTTNNWVAFTKPDTIKVIPNGGLQKNANNEIGISIGGIIDGMIKNDTISLSKFNQWGLEDSFSNWSAVKNPQSNANPVDWLNGILSAIKLLRGTTNYNTSNSQTISGAYTGFTNADNKAQQALDSIPQIIANSQSPETGFPNAKSGDLYFQILS